MRLINTKPLGLLVSKQDDVWRWNCSKGGNLLKWCIHVSMN